MRKLILSAIALIIAATSSSLAADKLKVAIPQKGFWDSSWVEFAEAAGFFKEAGLEVEIFWTEGGAQTVATVVSGSVDLALSNGILAAINPYVKGGADTPVSHIISAQMTGANELFWYVADSPCKSLKDVPEAQDHLRSLARLVFKPHPAHVVAAGGIEGQTACGGGALRSLYADHDRTGRCGLVGRAFALQDEADGKIRIIARAREATELQNQTIRVNLANLESLKTKRAAIVKFMQAYQKAVDWAYTNPKAIEMFAQNMKVSPAIAKKAVDEFYPKSAMQIGEIRDLERSLKDALDYKVIASPKTPKDIEGLFDIVYKP
jgi:NitT/TauT family transport system substrate-binding protein